MNKTLSIGLACLALFGGLGAARAADPDVQTRPIDARIVRVKVEGVVNLRIRQGEPGSITFRGDPRWTSDAVADQHGDTIHIDSQGRRALSPQMNVELVLPALRAVTSESLGTTEISGFSGEAVELTLDGAGSMRMAGSYRMVTANLGGIGSMTLQGLDAEGVKLNLQGAGPITLSGRTRWLKADMDGLCNLDARQLQADNVNIDLSGLGNAHVTARQNANLSLSGMGSVTVYGKPLNRKVAVDGLGKVSWQ